MPRAGTRCAAHGPRRQAPGPRHAASLWTRTPQDLSVVQCAGQHAKPSPPPPRSAPHLTLQRYTLHQRLPWKGSTTATRPALLEALTATVGKDGGVGLGACHTVLVVVEPLVHANSRHSRTWVKPWRVGIQQPFERLDAQQTCEELLPPASKHCGRERFGTADVSNVTHAHTIPTGCSIPAMKLSARCALARRGSNIPHALVHRAAAAARETATETVDIGSTWYAGIPRRSRGGAVLVICAIISVSVAALASRSSRASTPAPRCMLRRTSSAGTPFTPLHGIRMEWHSW